MDRGTDSAVLNDEARTAVALTSPLQLVTANPVPESVQWRPLAQLPAAPVTLAKVQAAQIGGLAVDVAYGPPVVIEENQLSYRSFTLVLAAPISGEGVPFPPVVGMWLVE